MRRGRPTKALADRADVDGTALARARVKADLTQADVAQALDCNASTVAGWERGEARPSLDTVRALARLYRVRVKDLLS